MKSTHRSVPTMCRFPKHLLISHQILGNVPPVVFIRDKQYGAVTEIENLLKKADFGPDEDNINHLSTNDVGAKLQLMGSEDMKRPVLFGVDHNALHKQIEAYKREKGARDSLTQSPAAGGLTRKQLDMLADIRKQKLIEKKTKKSRRMMISLLRIFCCPEAFKKRTKRSRTVMRTAWWIARSQS